MSIFNEANDLASQLVYGRHYQSNEPCPKPDRLVFVNGDSKLLKPYGSRCGRDASCPAPPARIRAGAH